MKKKQSLPLRGKSQIIIYKTEDGKTKIEFHLSCKGLLDNSPR